MVASFLLLGGQAQYAPAFGLAAMALGFAGLHNLYGVLIARWYGG